MVYADGVTGRKHAGQYRQRPSNGSPQEHTLLRGRPHMGQPLAAAGIAASHPSQLTAAPRVSAMIRPASCGVVTFWATCRLASRAIDPMPLWRARVRRVVMDAAEVTAVLISSSAINTSKTPLRPR